MNKVIPQDGLLVPETAKLVFSGVIFDVYQWQQKLFDGSADTFEMLRRPDTVTVIPVIGDKVLTIEDHQPYTGIRLSFPGGRVDKTDASTLSAAQREVKEETGYEFDNWRLVNVTQPHAKLEWFIYFYIASDGRKTTEPHLDAGEKISTKELTFTEAKSYVVTKSGYLGESADLFAKADSFEQLLVLPEFQGKEVDR